MSCESNEDGTLIICGNFEKLLPQKPEHMDYDKAYKYMEPWPDDWKDWRITRGKTTCDCKEIETHYQPWYGFTWYHSEECALLERVKERPQLRNLWQFEDIEMIGQSG